MMTVMDSVKAFLPVCRGMSESHSGEGEAATDTGQSEKTLACRECEKAYTSYNGLQGHYSSDNNECSGFECPTCGVSKFTNERGVQMHRARQHGESGSYYPNLSDEAWFRRKYVEEGCSTSDIADLVGCSRPQASAWKRKHGIKSKTEYKSRGTGPDNPMYNSIEVECDTCGETLTRPVSKVEKNGSNFCDWPCLHEWLRQRRGEDHPLYKPKKTLQYGPNWDEQSRKARERDDYRCQSCGKHQDDHWRALVGHHIVPREEFVDDKGVYDYERGNRLENLVALCDECHRTWEGVPVRPTYDG